MTEAPEAPKKGEDIVEEKLGTAIQKFVRRPEFSAFERLICSYLVQGITGPPLDTVIYTMRAAMTLDEDRCQLLGIDFQEIVSLYSVAQVINTAIKEDMYDNGGDPYMSMEVTTLDWDKDVNPWAKQTAYRFTYSYTQHTEYGIDKLLKSGNESKIFKESCRRLTIPGYNNLKADFLRYAMPKSQEITRKLSEIISPATYTEIFRVFISPQSRTPTGGEEVGQ